MNTSQLRMKNRTKAVTPVIATIILIAGTLVLALVVGAYTFGLFGSNVKTVTLSSATLYGCVSSSGTKNATSSLTLSLNNPGSASYITSLTMTGTAISSITGWCPNGDIVAAGGCTQVAWTAVGASNQMPPGVVTSFTFYPSSVGAVQASQSITTGQTFNYVINFANGQSVSGSLIAQ
jgi:hypothetical protein